jgi:hypothetical protein
VTEHRESTPADRPQPVAPPPGGGWPDLPGWSARAPEPLAPTVLTPPADLGASSTSSTPAPPAPASSPSDDRPPSPAGRSDGQASRAGSLAGAHRASVPTATTAARTGPRRARLTLRRIDPWSVLRFSFIAALALLVVFLVAVMVLYGVLAGMGVFSTINDQLHSLTGTDTSGGLHVNFSFGRVLGITLIVGVVNVVLFTALATLGAFVYNLVADLVGGIEVVLAERE